MRTITLLLLVGLAADVVMLAFLLGTVWVAHRAIRQEAAARGEVVPSAARDFRLLFAILFAGLIGLGAASIIVLSV